jgi:hypothetical protein
MTKVEILNKLDTNVRWLERAILALDARQTDDERSSGATVYDNDKGWNAFDASFGSYLARYIKGSRRPEGERLSGNWIVKARRMVRKYAGQLSRIAAAKQEAQAYADAAVAVLN